MLKKFISIFIVAVMSFTALSLLVFATGQLPASGSDDKPTRFAFGGYIQDDVTLIYPPQPRFTPFSLLPSRYIDDDYISVVEDQKDSSLCWAFAATSAVESNMLKNGQGLHNFSELHMGYSTAINHAGSRYGDSIRLTPDFGGNRTIAAAYLMRGIPLSGTVNESDDPYTSDPIPPRDVSITESKPRSYTVQNIIYLSGARKDDISEAQIKQAILEYGAVSASMYWGEDYNSVYNSVTHAYYLSNGPTYISGSQTLSDVNHAVTIVGWDDDFRKESFVTAPARDGAWRVKNTWSTDWGDRGFFWISYEDSNFPLNVYAVDGVKPFNPEATVYEYDFLRWGSWTGWVSNTNFYSRAFTVESNYEILEQVVVAIPTSGVTVAVDVIPNFSGFTPTNYNADIFNENIKGSKVTTHPGNYTVDLDVPVTLGRAGSKFAVIVRVTAANPNNSRIAHVVGQTADAGTSFMINPSIGFFVEERNENFCIKAITARNHSEDFCNECDELNCVCCNACNKFNCICCGECECFICICCIKCGKLICICCDECGEFTCVCCYECDKPVCICCNECGKFICICCDECEKLDCVCCNICRKADCSCFPYDLGVPTFLITGSFQWKPPQELLAAAEIIVVEYENLTGYYSFVVNGADNMSWVEGETLFSSGNNSGHGRVIAHEHGKIIFDLRGLEGENVIFNAPVSGADFTIKYAYLGLLPPGFFNCEKCLKLEVNCICVYCICGESEENCICVYCICGELEENCICIYCICGELEENCICIYCICDELEENCICFTLGCILGGSVPTIFDALEILKRIVGMASVFDEHERNPNWRLARNAALITPESREKEKFEPSIFDALEILKYIVGMDGILKRSIG
jgi:C1A family cysteine protease